MFSEIKPFSMQQLRCQLSLLVEGALLFQLQYPAKLTHVACQCFRNKMSKHKKEVSIKYNSIDISFIALRTFKTRSKP